MTKTIDGFVLDMPPIDTQVMALAQYHHKKIDEELFKDTHLGKYGLKQRFKVEEFAKTLSESDRENFYAIYGSELERLAKEDDHHAHDEPETANLGVVFVVLVIIAVTIYYLFARPLLG